MKVLKIMIVMLLLLMSVGAVCAADTIGDDVLGDGDQDTLETTQTSVYTTDDVGTFTDLQNEIDGADYVLNITKDYKFNATDNSRGIAIGKDNFVINGNGFTIDGNNQSRIFIINATNITINNLTIVNANSDRGSAFYINTGRSLTTNDVILKDSVADVGVIFVIGQYSSNNDKLTDAKVGNFGVVTLYYGANAIFNNALMMSSKELVWGFIYGFDNADIAVFNSTFANTTSKYTSAIRASKTTLIKGSEFINLHANITAGAIGLKDVEECEIDDCTFVNVTSEKNGGAIFIDAFSEPNTNQIIITDSRFSNCYSGFGGAILDLGGNFTVSNCNFTDNSAFFDGGAIYVSSAYVNVSNSTFENNHAVYEKTDRGTFGGAIFCDNGQFILEESTITDSSAQSGAAICLYDTQYIIRYNTFNNNFELYGNYSDICTVFEIGVAELENNTYSCDGNDSLSLNNTVYATIDILPGMELVLINNALDVSIIPSKFDLRDWKWVTPVRDQGSMGSCWTFGAAGAMESAILRYLGLEMDISENNMQDVSLQYYMYGTKYMTEGGSVYHAAAYAVNWLGVFSSEYDTYDELGKISPVISTRNNIHFQDVVFLPVREDSLDNDFIKEAILKYGALEVSYYAAQEAPYYNAQTCAQYCNESLPMDHGVTLVGWDDTYSAKNFLIPPDGDGAWIIKNSWGESYGIDGYFYISYYDLTFLTQMGAVAYVLNNTVQYNKNYQYDIGGEYDYYPVTEYRNFYTAVDDDLIAAVGTYFNDTNVEYTVEVYVNNVSMGSQNGVSPFAGFHTIKLDSYIPIKKGDTFAVKITSNAVPVFMNSRQHYIPGTSQYLKEGSWVNASDDDEVCSIKVYTVVDDSNYNFADLNNAIQTSESELNFTRNYVFNNLTDSEFTDGIVIFNKTLVIDGGNHIIDAAGQASIFKIGFSNVVLKNLIIENAIAGAIYAEQSNITTINVQFLNNKNVENGGAVKLMNSAYDSLYDVFINNTAKYGGAIIGIMSNLTTTNDAFINNTASLNGGAVAFVMTSYESRNDTFINNYADKGAALYSEATDNELVLDNGTFASDRVLNWGLIYLGGTLMDIENTTFANITSNYSTAIYSKKGLGTIRNCDFINLTAEFTAGAIAIKTIGDEITIENCNFIRTTSQKDAGAIFVDSSDDDKWGIGNITIRDAQFIECGSEFGGAYVQLGGELTVVNTNFTSNVVIFDGGAMYTSGLSKAVIANSSFVSNYGITPVLSNGGAAYFDNSTVILDSCIFENNVASGASSIYAYDSSLTLLNNLFNNPTTNSSSIFTVFDKKFVDDGNNFTNDNISTGNVWYAYNILGSQTSFVIINNTLSFDVLPDKFDLRDYGWVSPVRDQGNMGACWAFGAIASLESALMRYANNTYDFSENNLQDTMILFSKYGASETWEGGNSFLATSYFVSWLGVSPSEYDTYDQLGKISPLVASLKDVHIKDVRIIEPRVDSYDNDKIKEALVKFGSVMVGYMAANQPEFYNSTTHAYYYNVTIGMNHLVSIVGWDDNYSASNFVITPPGDGAFIVKNSWGEQFGDDGFFYVSYYDVSFGMADFLVAFDIKNNLGYDMIYQHEFGGMELMESHYNYYINTYDAVQDSLIAAVGTLFRNVTDYDIYVYVNGEKVYNQSGVSDYMGYSTIKLDKYIPIKAGDEFSVLVRNNLLIPSKTRTHAQSNVSFASVDGVNWIDLSENGGAAMLKVYTIFDIAYDLEKYYADETPFSVYVNPNEPVTFEVNGITATVLADKTGRAEIGINLEPGTYNVTVKTAEYSDVYTIEIISTVDCESAYVAYGSDYDFEIQLFDAAGNVLNNTAVNVTVNNETTEYTTDDNGSAVVKFTKLEGHKQIIVVNPVTGEEVSRILVVYLPTVTKFINVTVSGNYVVAAALVNISGAPLQNVDLNYTINGQTFNTTTDDNGIVVINTSLDSVIELIYAGNETLSPVNITIVLKDLARARAATVIESEDYTTYSIDFKAGERGNYFNVKLVDANGNPLANKAIKIGFNGVVYDRVTDSEGKTRLQINLKNAGIYTFAVAFLGDDDYNGTFVVNKITVNKKTTSISASAKTFKASAKTKSYTVTLNTIAGSSIDGKTYMEAGKKVTLTLNGKTYSATTNSKGQATFKLSISKRGKYAAEVKFAGDNAYEASSKTVKYITIN